ncbi:hypothetical protein MNEG_0171 [Monoraphidium neglectum]|uniref:Wax synthase domain-containing protein n=1 Tax=Monoraphidium neglectum TaxID=145388 RepID=A0A0D2NUL0_9CHLO|nr:hypothetical protein MNEG_0171 [Monoraphidium neglectum]KIZ07781.1 hypothetical protein MNEG_0171 [Monoraphidium neglectum]|eukprot:XP_013906800.1 hypothetical protein MNEG_0171 [Monoraphidium neglectum]
MSSEGAADMLQLLAAKSAAARPVLPPLLQHIAPVRAGVAIAHFAVLRSTLCWQTRMQLAAAATLACVALLTVSRRVAPGWRRFALLPPVLVVNILLPLLFDVQSELITRIAVTFLMTWLANFKVHGLVGVWMALGLAVNRGPLAMNDWGFGQLALLYSIPIYPTESQSAGKSGRLGDSAGGGRQLLVRFLAQTALLVAVAVLLVEFQLPALARYYALGLYGFISFLMTGPAVLLTAIAAIDVVPPFDAPWMVRDRAPRAATAPAAAAAAALPSVSLADFWARRWNNTVGLTLRSLCYDPIIESCIVRPASGAIEQLAGGKQQQQQRQQEQQQQQHQHQLEQLLQQQQQDSQQQQQPSDTNSDKVHASVALRPSRARRFWGTLMVFLMSGLAHELVLAYIMAPKFVWGASTFFFVQAPLLQLETSILRRLKRHGVQAPFLLRWLVSQGALMAAAHLFFFPVLEFHTDTAQRVSEVVSSNAQRLAAALGVHAAA